MLLLLESLQVRWWIRGGWLDTWTNRVPVSDDDDGGGGGGFARRINMIRGTGCHMWYMIL